MTELLLAWRSGDEAALNQPISAVYDEWHRIARPWGKCGFGGR